MRRTTKRFLFRSLTRSSIIRVVMVLAQFGYVTGRTPGAASFETVAIATSSEPPFMLPRFPRPRCTKFSSNRSCLSHYFLCLRSKILGLSCDDVELLPQISGGKLNALGIRFCRHQFPQQI